MFKRKKETGSRVRQCLILPQCCTNKDLPPFVVSTEIMITVISQNSNHFSQEFYDQEIEKVQLHSVECTCGKKGCLIRYGHYKRTVKFRSESIQLTVQRVMCKECHTTHALLLSLIVPYSQIPLEDQQEILEKVSSGQSPNAVMDRNFLIDENNIKYIIRQFRKHWEQRLLSIGKTLHDSLPVPCLHAFLRQFMQIHRTRNKLCTSANTS